MAVEFIHVIISLAILLFAAKLMAEIFHRIKLPIVLGELLAGIIVGPFALGGLYLVDGEPLVTLDETVRQVGEIARYSDSIHSGSAYHTTGIPKRWCCGVHCGLNRRHRSLLCWILCIHCIWSRGTSIDAYRNGIDRD